MKKYHDCLVRKLRGFFYKIGESLAGATFCVCLATKTRFSVVRLWKGKGKGGQMEEEEEEELEDIALSCLTDGPGNLRRRPDQTQQAVRK